MESTDSRLSPLLDLLPAHVRDQFAPLLANQFAQLPEEEKQVYLDTVPKLHDAVQQDDYDVFLRELAGIGYDAYGPLLWGFVKQ